MNAADALCFVDTNILVYAFDLSSGVKHSVAQELVKELWLKGSGCISVQVMQEFHVTVTQKIARPISLDESFSILQDLSHWKVYCSTSKDILAALLIQQKDHLSFWDAQIIHSAAASGCGILYSEDLNAGENIGGTKIVNPFAALN